MIHISLAAEKVGVIFGWPVLNSLLAGLMVSIGLIMLGAYSWYHFREPAKTIGQLHPRLLILEESLSGLLGLFESVLGSRSLAIQFFPLLTTLFIFIIANNYFGLLPGVGSILLKSNHGQVPLFRPATADLNTTLALAITSVIMIQYYGIKQSGVARHLKKFFNFSNPILLGVGILELISEFSKMVSFSFRLFGNIFAGEVLLVVIGFLVPFVAPLPFYGLELFVGFVQALVFMMLTLVFLKVATVEH